MYKLKKKHLLFPSFTLIFTDAMILLIELLNNDIAGDILLDSLLHTESSAK